MSGIDLLRRIGEALYGERWQSPLARDLAVAVRTVQRWAVGDTPIPSGVWSDLGRLLAAREGDIATLRQVVINHSGAGIDDDAAAPTRAEKSGYSGIR